MSTYVKGDAVANATSYELLEKTAEGAYTSLAEASEINFELDALGLAAGDHTLVVKAKADGYEDSDASNEVVYTVEEEAVEEIVLVSPQTFTMAAGAASFNKIYTLENSYVEGKTAYALCTSVSGNMTGKQWRVYANQDTSRIFSGVIGTPIEVGLKTTDTKIWAFTNSFSPEADEDFIFTVTMK